MKVPDYKYLIIGAGMTADAAVRGIREMDPDGSIGLVGRESDPPYNRPPLTKALWKGKPLEKIWRQTEQLSVTLHLGQEILSLNAGKHSAQAVDGATYTGEKILLATGGTPRRPAPMPARWPTTWARSCRWAGPPSRSPTRTSWPVGG
jgi:NAD(P)H-nitrite reductase large subunit